MANLLKIKEFAEKKNIPLEHVAKDSGITVQGLYKIIRENSTKVETLEKIAKSLDVPISVFFEDGNFQTISENNGIAVTGDSNKIFAAEQAKMLDMIAKKDEQIDRLLSIIEISAK